MNLTVIFISTAIQRENCKYKDEERTKESKKEN